MASEDRYRLAPVRDARARDERSRRGELAAAVGSARELADRLEAARARTAAARHALADAITARAALVGPAHATTSSQLVRADRFIARRRRELEGARGEELRAEAAHDERLGSVDDARRHLLRARADRELVERHFARWRDARRRLADRRDD